MTLLRNLRAISTSIIKNIQKLLEITILVNMRIVSCSRDEQRESSEGGGSGCDGAAAQNNLPHFTKLFGTSSSKLFHKIILDEQFKIITQNYFGRAVQNYFTK